MDFPPLDAERLLNRRYSRLCCYGLRSIPQPTHSSRRTLVNDPPSPTLLLTVVVRYRSRPSRNVVLHLLDPFHLPKDLREISCYPRLIAVISGKERYAPHAR